MDADNSTPPLALGCGWSAPASGWVKGEGCRMCCIPTVGVYQSRKSVHIRNRRIRAREWDAASARARAESSRQCLSSQRPFSSTSVFICLQKATISYSVDPVDVEDALVLGEGGGGGVRHALDDAGAVRGPE